MTSANDGEANDNEDILAEIEALGGDYVWEPELFVVTLLDAELTDAAARRLCELVGVQQIALNARGLTLEGLENVARIPGLSSLVRANCSSNAEQLARLSALEPEVELDGGA